MLKKKWVYDIEEAQIGLPGLHNYRRLEPLGQYHKPYSLTKKLVKFFSLALQNILKYKTFFYLHDVLWSLLTNFTLLSLLSP